LDLDYIFIDDDEQGTQEDEFNEDIYAKVYGDRLNTLMLDTAPLNQKVS
jgi:hypothetical protein